MKLNQALKVALIALDSYHDQLSQYAGHQKQQGSEALDASKKLRECEQAAKVLRLWRYTLSPDD